jgi:glycosyltransferase involved in cell wall biosynthesis
VQVLTNPVLRRSLGAGGRRLVEQQYDWGKLGARLVARLQQLREDARRAPAA